MKECIDILGISFYYIELILHPINILLIYNVFTAEMFTTECKYKIDSVVYFIIEMIVKSSTMMITSYTILAMCYEEINFLDVKKFTMLICIYTCASVMFLKFKRNKNESRAN